MNDPISVPVKGKRKRRVLISSRQLQRLENAKRRLADITNEVILSNPLSAKAICPPSPLKPCKDLVEEYFASQPHLKAKTVSERRRGLNVLIRFVGPKPLHRGLIEEFNAELHKTRDYEAGGRWLIGSCVAMFLNWLWDSKRIDSDWKASVKFPVQPRQKPRKPYAADEVRKLIETAGEKPLAFVVLLGFSTGFSLCDAANLEWQHVDMDNFVIRRNRSKTDIEAMITFGAGSELHLALQRQQEETRRAFGSIQPGFPVCKWAHNNKISVAICFKRLCEKAGVPYRSFHSFRATMLGRLVGSAMPLNVAMKVAGLTNPKQMLAYVATTPENIRTHLSQLRG